MENNGQVWQTEVQDPRQNSPHAPKVQVSIMFDQTELGKLKSDLQILEANINEDVNMLREVRVFL